MSLQEFVSPWIFVGFHSLSGRIQPHELLRGLYWRVEGKYEDGKYHLTPRRITVPGYLSPFTNTDIADAADGRPFKLGPRRRRFRPIAPLDNEPGTIPDPSSLDDDELHKTLGFERRFYPGIFLSLDLDEDLDLAVAGGKSPVDAAKALHALERDAGLLWRNPSRTKTSCSDAVLLADHIARFVDGPEVNSIDLARRVYAFLDPVKESSAYLDLRELLVPDRSHEHSKPISNLAKGYRAFRQAMARTGGSREETLLEEHTVTVDADRGSEEHMFLVLLGWFIQGGSGIDSVATVCEATSTGGTSWEFPMLGGKSLRQLSALTLGPNRRPWLRTPRGGESTAHLRVGEKAPSKSWMEVPITGGWSQER